MSNDFNQEKQEAWALVEKADPTCSAKGFRVVTRNWNGCEHAHKLLNQVIDRAGGQRFENAAGDLDDKYMVECDSAVKALAVAVSFILIRDLSGGTVRVEAV